MTGSRELGGTLGGSGAGAGFRDGSDGLGEHGSRVGMGTDRVGEYPGMGNGRRLQGKSTNGSRKRSAKHRKRRIRWANTGILVGSVNIKGLNGYKLRILLEIHDFDVLCIQETWLTGPVDDAVKLPGYTLLE